MALSSLASRPSPQCRSGVYLRRSLPRADPHLAFIFTMSQFQPPELSVDVHKQLLAGFDIFHPSRLSTEDHIAVAVNVLEGSLDNKSIGPIILCSLQPEHPYVFEFIVSSISEDGVKLVSQFILERIPSNTDGFHDSLAYQVLFRLAHSLSRLPYPSGQQPDNFDGHRRDTEAAPALLEDLSRLSREGYLDGAETAGKTNKNTQRGKTQRSKVTSVAHAEISDRLFQALGREEPKSRESAKELAESIIAAQKNTLKFFTTLMQTPDIARLVRSAYFRENVLQGNLSISDEQVTASSAMGLSSSLIATTSDLIQADLYFESAANYGKWRILCSGLCLSNLARDGAQSDPVLRRLEELSSGCFSETNQIRLTKDSPIEIYRARLPGNVRLVYHIDVIHEFGKDFETQVLRVLGIYSVDELNRTDWDKLGKYRARKGPNYIAKCRARNCSRGFYFDPVTFDATVTSTKAVFAGAESPVKDDVEGVDEIHKLLDLEQYAILSQNVIRDILEGNDHPHVFQVSREEKKVIECTRSSFVLGRSGTGKTTVIVFKIFGIERAWQNQGCVGPRPRQLFLTKSRLLAEKVERDYVSLLYSLSTGPDAPLYVRERIQRWNTRRKKVIFNPDDTGGERDDLPQKFSELRDRDFPLFLTMETLSSLLEADMKPTPGSSRSRNSRSKRKNQEWSGRTDLVTYDVFKRMYWPHFPRSLTKGVSSSIAFSEFLGTIRGSEKSLDYPNRTLDREAYENLRNGHKVDYSLFEAYHNLKLKRGERDLADKTHMLLSDLNENGLKGELVDFAYVDEVQDLLLIDTRLIISLCRNPDGLVWAGDTAQTISIGSTFTFKQLGASVWRYQRSIRALRGTPRQPEGFQLLKNYRSHGGIVECANAIIQLLQRFPGAIDLLRPEAGVVGKELPKFFHGEGFPQGRDFFLSKSEHLSRLGHNQCIIVRDDAARESFKSEIGRVGVTLTLFNSKGLEYDDVILYNFFEESAPENFWQFLVDANQNKLLDSRYAPLIHELKCFYVAITRAKHRLWIVDYSEKCRPIMRCLLDRGLVIEPPITRNPLESFANKSSSGEWSEEGNRLLNHREFEEAILAFDNAGDVYMRAVAAAYQSREVARDVPESQTRRRREAFMNAASAFEYCAEMTKSAEELSNHYGAAARCYAEIKYHQDAVRAFKLANMFTEAASYCFDHNLLDTAVSIIKKYDAEVSSQTKECIKEVARLSYLESKQLVKAADLFKDDEEEMMEFVVEHDLGATRAVILVRQGKYGEAVRQYLDEGQDSEALDLALEHIGDVIRDGNALNAIIEKFFWRNLSFGRRGWPENAGIPSDKILAFLERTRNLRMNESDQKMLFIFKLILHDMKSKTTQRILSNHVLRSESLKPNKALRLLALDFLFDDMSSALDVSSQAGTISSLELFYEYSRLIRDAALDKAPWESPWLTTLFQFEKDGEGIQIRPETALYEDHITRVPAPDQSTDLEEPSAISLSREEFTRNLRMLLSERLRSRIAAKALNLLRLHLFDPCIQFILHGTCRGDHSASHQLDEEWFNRRARFHLLHVVILENLHAFDPLVDFRSRIWKQRDMLNALGNVLNPLLYHSGTISILNENLIPEAADGFSTVKRWAFDVLYALDPSRLNLQGAFLTNLSTAFILGRLHQDGLTVDEHLHRIPSTTLGDQPHPRLMFRLPSGSPIYTLHDFLGFIDGTGDLSRGIRFFRYLVRERIPIDLAVLCNIMEKLFGLAILTGKCQSYLHGVLLPQSWILALWKDFVTFKERALAPLYVLAQWTETLLKDVYTGKYLRDTIRDFDRPSALDQQHKVENWSKDLPRKYLQDLCIARICRCLSLLGENFPHLRNDVVRTMGSFRTAKRPEATAFHWGYISSQSWPNIAKVLYESTPQPFDQLVRLQRRNFPLPDPCPPSVQLVVFDNMNTIPGLLRPRSMNRQGHHRRRGIDIGTASQANFGPSGTVVVGHTSDAHGVDSPSDIPSGDQRAEGLAEYTAQDADDSEETDRTKEVIVIQRAARRHFFKNIEEHSNNALTKGRDRLFRSCKASADAVHAKYRKIYLGPVPHLLLCVEWIVTRAEESKNAIKARRVEATLQEKSDLMLQHKQIRVILYEARNLQKRIEPGSNVHPGANIEGEWDGGRHLEPVRLAITQARDLLDRLEDPEAPTNEFEIAWNGIMPSRLRERS